MGVPGFSGHRVARNAPAHVCFLLLLSISVGQIPACGFAGSELITLSILVSISQLLSRIWYPFTFPPAGGRPGSGGCAGLCFHNRDKKNRIHFSLIFYILNNDP